MKGKLSGCGGMPVFFPRCFLIFAWGGSPDRGEFEWGMQPENRPETNATLFFCRHSGSRCSVILTVSGQDKVAEGRLTTFLNGKFGRERSLAVQFHFAFRLWSKYLKTVKCIRRPDMYTQRL